MTTYRLGLCHGERHTTVDLMCLDELAERVAVEQLMHELNPVDPAGYVVTFVVHAGDHVVMAAGHFYVRGADVTTLVAGNRLGPS